jgi:hypothetical protein
LWEVSVLLGNAWRYLSKVPLQGFWKIPAVLCDGFPARPPSTLPGFDIVFVQMGGFNAVVLIFKFGNCLGFRISKEE